MDIMEQGIFELEAWAEREMGLGVVGSTTIKVRCINSPYPLRYAISVGAFPHPKLIDRVIMAIESGAALPNPELKVDKNGDTYISTGVELFGGSLTQDLKRLGY